MISYRPQWYIVLRKSLKIISNLFFQYGYFKTLLKGVPIDKDGEPIPWYTYPLLEFLTQFDYSQKKVFEYGCGNSSLFWGKRALEVISVEDDKQWFEKMMLQVNKKDKIFFSEDKTQYLDCIAEQGVKFDIIIIDASYREECCTMVVPFLAEGGLVILDNSDWYKESCGLLRKQGLTQIDFSGFGPFNTYSWTSSIFFKDKLQLSGLNGQPGYSLAVGR